MTTPLTGVVGTLPLPNTTVAPIAGEPVQAAQVQVITQALLDQDATLEEYAAIDLTGRPGGNPRAFQFNLGITVLDGVLTDAATMPVSGSPKIKLNATNAGEAELVGPVKFTGAAPAATADPGDDNLLQTGNIILAHGKIDFDNGTVTIVDGYNVASATISISVQANVVFKRPMATADYTIVLGSRKATTFLEYPILLSQSTTGFSCNIRDLFAGGAAIDLTAEHPGELYFIVTGSQ